MNVVGISGTPRKGGNSEVLLDAALAPFTEAGWTVTRLLLSELRIEPCIGCETCVERHSCILSDDMQKIYEAFEACDAILVSSPVYWRNVPAQLKALFDRTYGASASAPLRGKFGGAMAVGRGTGGGQAIVLNVIHNFFLSSGALCVPGELNGVSAQADKPGDIRSRPRRLHQAQLLGENVLQYASRRVR